MDTVFAIFHEFIDEKIRSSQTILSNCYLIFGSLASLFRVNELKVPIFLKHTTRKTRLTHQRTRTSKVEGYLLVLKFYTISCSICKRLVYINTKLKYKG